MKKDHGYLNSPRLLQALGEYPEGTWVAISEDERVIIGSGSTPTRAEKQAQAAGYKPRLLVQVSTRNSSNKPERNGNGKHEAGVAVPLNLPSFYRGIYKRVAKRLGCDPSYVSRVARGQRASNEVSQALQSELNQAMIFTNKGRSRRQA